jgi:tetratricopeptide (TPR) repeat protein
VRRIKSSALGLLGVCGFFSIWGPIVVTAPGAEPDLPAATAARTEETNSQETLMSILRLQEQVHAAQLAIERNREEAQAAAARNTEALAGRLNGIEQALAAQRAKELEAIQSSNKVMLTVASLFGGLGCAAMLFSAFFQWRTINRLAEISTTLPRALGAAPVLGALAAEDSDRVTVGPAEQASQRLLGALERLEKRIFELEHTTRPHLQEGPAIAPEISASPPQLVAEPASAEKPEAARITLLLGKGQSHLNLDQNEAAVACFDEVLAMDGNHPEALVRKGAALDRLRRLDEAIACYDRAIAADSSKTVATVTYLYKGGLLNRLERFNEALECYEMALRAQESRQV